MNILGAPSDTPKKKKKKLPSLTSVPVGYSLKLQGTDVCSGKKAIESGTLEDAEPVSRWGDPKSMVMMNRAKELCDTNKQCKFISVSKTGKYSVFDECKSTKFDPMNTSITLQNTSFVTPTSTPASRPAVAAPMKTPTPPPPPPPPPPPYNPEHLNLGPAKKLLPPVKNDAECTKHIANLKAYDENETYPGWSLSNKKNYCVSMLSRPTIARGCQQKICGFSSGPAPGTVIPIGEEGNPWQEIPHGNTKYYYNTKTGVSQANTPNTVFASKDDFFQMREFCSEACRNLTANENISKDVSRSGSIEDAFGEVSQVPGIKGGNPWMPTYNIMNELPDITDDDCLGISVRKEPRWECNPNRVSACDLDPPVSWKPTLNTKFYLNQTTEEECGENPRQPGVGVSKAKKVLGVTEDRKACKVRYYTTKSKCSRDCKLRFLNSEASEAGYVNRNRKKITWADMELKAESGGGIDTEQWSEFFEDNRITTDLRKSWEIGRMKGVKWGLDLRPGYGILYTGEGKGELLHPDAWGKMGPDAPHGYKIYAELVKIRYPALSGGKKCLIEKDGWYRTAKVPITDSEMNDIAKLRLDFGFHKKGFVKHSAYNKLINEDWDEGRSVLIIPHFQSKEEPRFEKVCSKQ